MLRYLDEMKYVSRMLRGNDYAFARSAVMPGLYMKLQQEAAEHGIKGEALDYWTSLVIWGADGANMSEPGAESRLLALADQYSAGDEEVKATLRSRVNARAAAHRHAVNQGKEVGSYEYHLLMEEVMYTLLPDSWRSDLEQLAGRATYNIRSGDPLHKDRWGTSLMDMANAFKEKHPAARFLFPYVKIVSMIMNTGFDMSPTAYFHYKKLLADKARGEDAVIGATAHDLEYLQFQALAGSTIMASLMALAAASIALDDEDPYFDITGRGPVDYNLRNQLRQTGYQEYTVKIGGTRWNYQMTPLAVPLAFLGSVMDQARYNTTEDTGRLENLTVAFLRGMPAMLDQTFMGTVSDLMDVLSSPNPETQKRKLNNIFTRVSTGFIVPNFAKQFTRFLDPTLRDADHWYQEFLQEMPFPVPTLLGGRPRLNALGEPIMLGASSVMLSLLELPLGRDMNRFGRLVTFERSKEDLVWGTLARAQVRIPQVTRGIMLDGVAMNDDQIYEFAQKRGGYLKSWIAQRISSGAWEGANRETMQADVRRMSRQLTNHVKAAMVTGDWGKVPGLPPEIRRPRTGEGDDPIPLL